MMSHSVRRSAWAAAIAAVGSLALAGVGLSTSASAATNPAPVNAPASAADPAPKQESANVTDAVSSFQQLSPGELPARAAGVSSDASPEALARAFLAGPRSQVRVASAGADTELVLSSVQPSAASGTVVRFGQQVDGVPVFGGEVLVDLDKSGSVRSAAAESLPGAAPDVTPAVSPAQASAAALASVARDTRVPAASLRATTPQRWIYDPRILGRSGTAQATLVWRTEVISTTGRTVDHLVLVDARTGVVALDLDQIESARDRRICDADNFERQVPCVTPVRAEGGPATSVADVDAAYDFSGDTYDFFWSRFGRDSMDNHGMAMTSTVRYCEWGQCPLDNAAWDPLYSQVVYGDGYVADDVVGHELTHGVTSFMSDLIYDRQSGAINESLSDTFGEFIDQTNSRGTDTSKTRWKVGEDVKGGPVRDMANPPAFDSPDRMGSPLYDQGDYGSVHTNSGIGDKFTFLLTDGGNFNGRTVTGLGLTKAPLIIYWAANLLTSSSDYAAYGRALQASCASLIGSNGITKGDCAQVKTAGQAVEIIPTSPTAPDPPAAFPASRQVSLAWTTPFDAMSAITDYVVQYSANGGTSWTTVPDGRSTGTMSTVPGLSNSIGYRFRVAAVNALGTSAFSDPSAAVTPGTLPPSSHVAAFAGSPLRVPQFDPAGALSPIAVPAGIGTITKVTATLGLISASWPVTLNISLISPAGTEIPLSNGNGGDQPNYEGTVFDDSATTPITSGTAPFTGTFRPEGSLAALNGESPTGTWRLKVVDASDGKATIRAWSVTIWGSATQTIMFTPPGRTSMSARGVSLSASATSGLPVAFASATPAVCTVAGSTATLVSAGTCTIRASQAGNATWVSAPPVARSFQVTAVPPGPPASARVAGFPGPRQASVVWTPPANNGGYRVSGYRLRVSAPNSTAAFGPRVSTSAARRVLAGLMNGATYRVQIVAVTAAGTSPPRTVVFRQATVAAQVRDLRVASMPAAGKATIAWNPPAANGGTPVVRYLMFVTAPDSGTYGPWVATTTTSRTLTNLRKGSLYRVQVIAVNSQGNSTPITVAFRQAR